MQNYIRNSKCHNMSDQTIHSIHSFMFPFRWDYICQNQQKEFISYTSRTNLNDFDRVYKKAKSLKRVCFKIDLDNENYNEYTYFHDYVRPALYHTAENENDLNKNDILYYELDGDELDYFNIKTKHDGEFNLKLYNVCMHIYSTGVGIITINLRNYKYDNAYDILKINEFGRRIYPQFIKNNTIDDTKDAFLALSVYGSLKHLKFSEDFKIYEKPIPVESTFRPPDFIKCVLGYESNELESKNKYFVFRKEFEKKGNIRISKVTDDRMFFVSWYGNDNWANINKMDYLNSNWWYAYMFGDKNSKSIANDCMQKDQVMELTYQRWSNYGTLFAMTRDSFVGISSSSKTLISINVPDLRIHMETMYYQMSVLCLIQRASVLRFSYEVTIITKLLEENCDVTKPIKDLYKNYIHFINRIYFREVSSQIQGIEMYKKFQEVMELQKDVHELKEEIQELYNYISLVEQSNLSKVAIWFLPAGVIVGLLGMNIFGLGLDIQGSLNWNVIIWIIFVLLISYLSTKLISKYLNKNLK